MAIHEVMTRGKAFIIRKYCEYVYLKELKPVPFLDMRALHNEPVVEIGLLRILLFSCRKNETAVVYLP